MKELLDKSSTCIIRLIFIVRSKVENILCSTVLCYLALDCLFVLVRRPVNFELRRKRPTSGPNDIINYFSFFLTCIYRYAYLVENYFQKYSYLLINFIYCLSPFKTFSKTGKALWWFVRWLSLDYFLSNFKGFRMSNTEFQTLEDAICLFSLDLSFFLCVLYLLSFCQC